MEEVEYMFEGCQFVREWIGLLFQILTLHLFFLGMRDDGQMKGYLG